MASWTTTSTSTRGSSSSQSHTESQSTKKKVLDEALLQTILGGLTGAMSREEIAQYAENLLAPRLSASMRLLTAALLLLLLALCAARVDGECLGGPWAPARPVLGNPQRQLLSVPGSPGALGGHLGWSVSCDGDPEPK